VNSINKFFASGAWNFEFVYSINSPLFVRQFMCAHCITSAQQEGGDLTMTILYQWAKECGNIVQLPDSFHYNSAELGTTTTVLNL
jgi:hypothetical protein